MIYVLCFTGIAYLVAMAALIYGFLRLPRFSSEKITPKTQFSLVIPFRNEAKNLPKLLESIQQLKYPSHLFEIIFVDDASEDTSVEIINEKLKFLKEFAKITIITNERHSASPKKDAITAAITIASMEWIITTDADCELPKNWLVVFDGYIQKQKPLLVAGPVRYAANASFVAKFQKFDGLSLQAVTIGSFGLQTPLLCNGANLAYKKEAFEAVNGFAENNHIASGDDIFMLEKMQQKFPKRVHFLKSEEAIVTTQPQQNWLAVINQRIRWASKTSKQKSWISKALGLLVFLTNLMMLLGAVYCVFQKWILPFYVLFLLLKVFADFLVLKISSRFFFTKIEVLPFLSSALIYPFITILVVLNSVKGSYNWKGRKFEKNT